jgi:hypothetical protein
MENSRQVNEWTSRRGIARTNEIALTAKAVSLASTSVGQRPTKASNGVIASPERAKSNGVNWITPFQGLDVFSRLLRRALPYAVICRPFRAIQYGVNNNHIGKLKIKS